MRFWRDQRGFTLAQLLTAFAILGLVLAGVTTIQQSVIQAYLVGSNKTEVQQSARVAVERMAREIRQTSGALTSANTTSLTFVDQDTGTTTYSLDGTILTRTAGGASQPMVAGIQALAFGYRDVNGIALGVPVGTPANVFRIDITITTRSEDTVVANGISDTRAEITTSVTLRNL